MTELWRATSLTPRSPSMSQEGDIGALGPRPVHSYNTTCGEFCQEKRRIKIKKMEYTKKEIAIVGDAMTTASAHLETASELLEQFYDDYFTSLDLDELIKTATYKPERLRAAIIAVKDYLFEARVEVDSFACTSSPAVEYEQYKAQRRQRIIDVAKSFERAIG